MAKQQSIGALWIKQGSKGQYLSGYVEVDGQKIPLVCFTNGYKKEAKHPDYQMYKSEQKERTEEPRDNQAELNNLGNDDNQDVYPDF